MHRDDSDFDPWPPRGSLVQLLSWVIGILLILVGVGAALYFMS